MRKLILMLPVFFLCHLICYGQATGEKMLFIIDSIPQITDPGEWNTIASEDIADIVVIRNRDSVNRLGWSQVDAITYIFTHAYRLRPDSIKQLPGLLQMVQRDGAWYFHNDPYTGRYIDYYSNGRMKDEGVLKKGMLNGQVIVYFQSGAVKSRTDYTAGVQNGYFSQYYKSGTLMQKSGFVNGKSNHVYENYYSNGQTQGEKKAKKNSRYDTLVNYYSTGEIKSVRLCKNGEPVGNKNEEDINYYATMFLQSWNKADIKEMEKNLSHLLVLDSNNVTTRFDAGVLLDKEHRFDDAIAAFDKALQAEPLDRNGLLWRGLAHLRKQHCKRLGCFLNDVNEITLALEDFTTLPLDEQRKVCHDLQLADELDVSDYFVKIRVPDGLLNDCKNPGSR